MRQSLPLLLAAALLLSACRDDTTRRVLPPGVRVDTYAQTAAQQVDVLWVVDNSGSMAPRQENLARNFTAFVDRFQRSAVDFRLAVTTTDTFRDAGRLHGSPAVLTPQTPGLTEAFGRNIRVGTNGSPYEAGMEAARMALIRLQEQNQPTLDVIAACQNACAPGTTLVDCRADCVNANPVSFLRPNAYLYLVFVTDEEDRSEKDVRTFYRFFETVKGLGNDGMVSTAAIMGDVPSNTCQATPGTRYAQLSALTGGEVGSICDPEFATTLEKLADNAVGLKRKFALGSAPNLDTLEVFVRYRCDAPESNLTACSEVDRAPCTDQAAEAIELVCKVRKGAPDGWEYEEANRVIFFAGDSVPNVPSQVELQYYEEGKSP